MLFSVIMYIFLVFPTQVCKYVYHSFITSLNFVQGGYISFQIILYLHHSNFTVFHTFNFSTLVPSGLKLWLARYLVLLHQVLHTRIPLSLSIISWALLGNDRNIGITIQNISQVIRLKVKILNFQLYSGILQSNK